MVMRGGKTELDLKADELIQVITKKLINNKSVISGSLGFGRLTWRVKRNGEIEVNLEPKL